MNENKNNRKKIIIIVVLTIIIIIVGILLIFGNVSEKTFQENVTINCTFSQKFKFMNIIINSNVNYENDVFKNVKEKYEIKLIDEKLIQNIDLIEEKYKQEISKKMGEYISNFNVEKIGNSIFITLDVDADTYEKLNKQSKEIVGETSINYSQYYYGPKNLQEYVEGQGGECVYE